MAEKRKVGSSNALINAYRRRRFELPIDDALWEFDPNDPSPNDPTKRKVLKVNDLNLDHSYVKEYKPQTRPLRPRKFRPWMNTGPRNGGVHAIDLPKRWHTRDDDLDPNDIDGQIERAHERIEENIRPEIFRHRLAIYSRAKKKLELLRQAEPQAESYETARRLQVLRKMKVQMTGEGKDRYNQMPNIDAIINAYETKELSWNPGLVTYWSRGRKLCQPRPFDWDEFEAISEASDGAKSFWTEGLNGPDPVSMLLIQPIQMFPRTHPSSMTEIYITVRIPNFDWWIELPFVHDTGASTMTIYQEDLTGMLGPHRANNPYIPLLGEQALAGFGENDEVTHYPWVELEATICNEQGERLTEWTRVPAIINDQYFDVNGGTPRVDGPITRALLYMASAPDGTGRNYICQKKNNLFRTLPVLDLESNPPTLNSQHVVNNLYPPNPTAGIGPFPDGLPFGPGNPAPPAPPLTPPTPPVAFNHGLFANNGTRLIPFGVNLTEAAQNGAAQNGAAQSGAAQNEAAELPFGVAQNPPKSPFGNFGNGNGGGGGGGA